LAHDVPPPREAYFGPQRVFRHAMNTGSGSASESALPTMSLAQNTDLANINREFGSLAPPNTGSSPPLRHLAFNQFIRQAAEILHDQIFAYLVDIDFDAQLLLQV